MRKIVLDALRDEPATPGFHALLMRILLGACAAADEAETGLAAADEALEMGGGTELWEAEIRRLRAEFLSGLGADPREVEAELCRAIEVAGHQGARSCELRARSSLERLLAERAEERSRNRRRATIRPENHGEARADDRR